MRMMWCYELELPSRNQGGNASKCSKYNSRTPREPVLKKNLALHQVGKHCLKEDSNTMDISHCQWKHLVRKILRNLLENTVNQVNWYTANMAGATISRREAHMRFTWNGT